MQIVLLGPPGAGKGTQAILLSKQFSIPHISTGEMLRQQVFSGSKLGLQVKDILDQGSLVPDDLIVQVVERRVSESDCKLGFLLDGFPRTVNQAQALDEILLKAGKPLTHVFQLLVPEQVLLDRIQLRRDGNINSARTDDTLEVAAKRLQVYWTQTAPVASYYRNLGLLREIDGVGSVEDVTDRIVRVAGGVDQA